MDGGIWDPTQPLMPACPSGPLIGPCSLPSYRPLQAKASRAYSRAGAVAHESVANVRTVAAYCQEEACLKSYARELDQPTKVGTQGQGTSLPDPT